MSGAVIIFLIASVGVAVVEKIEMRQMIMISAPVIALSLIWNAESGITAQFIMFNMEVGGTRIDALSRAFAIIFCIAAALISVYAMHLRDTLQQSAMLIYAGSAVGAVLAPDLISLFFYWEITAIASSMLIFARRTIGAYHVAIRYLIVQISSGILLLAGTTLIVQDNGTADFINLATDGQWSMGVWLVFIAFGIKCAFPLLHNWLQDAYPSATLTGSVALSVFSTKMAVYCIARGFAGTEWLIYIGVVMTIFPIFFAEIENDLRRVLAYSLNNQLGFMVVGIGIGTPLALNGTVAHAFCHILYKALLFMTVGAALYRTHTTKAYELGGLYKTMPITTICCVIGAASIAAFPLFSGFISKSLILEATAKNHYIYIWIALIFASAGVMSHSGIKIPYCTFFADNPHNSRMEFEEAPNHMLTAMIITAMLCIFIGIYPTPLYDILPYDMKLIAFVPYTWSHVISQMQLLCFALLAFFALKHIGFYVSEQSSINLDTDWAYRKLAPRIVRFFAKVVKVFWGEMVKGTLVAQKYITEMSQDAYNPAGRIGTTQTGGTMALWIAILLGIALFLSLINFGI